MVKNEYETLKVEIEGYKQSIIDMITDIGILGKKIRKSEKRIDKLWSEAKK